MTINIDNGLVGYWSLNEGSGTTAKDKSGNGNDGTLQNMDDSDWVDGVVGRALDFDGSNDHLDCGKDSSLQPTDELTISTWIKPKPNQEYCYDGSKGNYGVAGSVDAAEGTTKWSWQLRYGSADACTLGWQVNTEAGSKWVTIGSNLPTDSWTHILATFNGTEQKIYVDNVLKDTETFAATTIKVDVDNKILMGVAGWGNSNTYYEGKIDEFRIYNRELNDAEISWLFKNPGGSPPGRPSARIMIADLDGNDNAITENLSNVTIITKLSETNDYFSYLFSFDIVNESDAYSFIQKGCNIEIETGIAGANTKKLTGNITEALKTLEQAKIKPLMHVSGVGGGTRLSKIFFSGRFYDLEVSALAKAILDTIDYTSGETYRTLAEVDASNEYIESTAYSVDEATYVWKTLEAAITELAKSIGFEWYRDVDTKLHFFDPTAAGVVTQIIDKDLDGIPEIKEEGEIINRAVVIGGFQQNTDRSGETNTTTTTVTDTTAKNQSFVPTEDYLSSVLVYTEKVTDSTSAITLSIQNDSAGAPDEINIANGLKVMKVGTIIDAGYTEFRFAQDVTLTPDETYWLVLKGSTADGVKVGIDGSAVLDYVTRYPVRVAIMVNDSESQERYKNADGTLGIYMKVHRDTKIEDSDYAEQIANSLLNPNSKKIANVAVHGDTITAGDVVLLMLSTAGITINSNMKVTSSTQTLKDSFILNSLELEEI